METIRRILMTAVMSIVATGSGAQIVFGLAVSMVFMKLYAYCLPFKEFDNNVLQEVGKDIFFISAIFYFTQFVLLIAHPRKHYLRYNTSNTPLSSTPFLLSLLSGGPIPSISHLSSSTHHPWQSTSWQSNGDGSRCSSDYCHDDHTRRVFCFAFQTTIRGSGGVEQGERVLGAVGPCSSTRIWRVC